MGKGSTSRICVGAISGVRGVHGEIRIKPFTEQPENVGAYGDVETEDGQQRFTLRRLKVRGKDVTAFIDGVTDRSQAEALKGTRLYVSRETLPALEDDEFYFADLVGLAVEDERQGVIGQIQAVHDFGAGDILEVRLNETGRNVMVPFTREVIPNVDIEGGKVMMDAPDGLLDEPEEEGGKA